MRSQTTPPDVLVVGAGPTGLFLACELLRHGLTVRVVANAGGVDPMPPAALLHARTLEILGDRGLLQGALARGLRLETLRLYAGGKSVMTAHFPDLFTECPYLLSLPQAALEELLLDHLASCGGRVERQLTLVDLIQGEEAAKVRLQTSEGESEAIVCPWIVACDGAQSAVRGLLPVGVRNQVRKVVLVADGSLRGEMAPDGITVFSSPIGLLVCLPLPGGRWRFIVTGSDGNEPIDVAFLQRLFQERTGLVGGVDEPVVAARYRVPCGQAERYREGRVFLAGAAGHSRDPLSGLGMNSGIQDAHNLGWKLALYHKGEARGGVLESYEDERYPIGRAQASAGDSSSTVAAMRSPGAKLLKANVARFLGSLDLIQQGITRQLSANDVRYAHSPVIQEHRPGFFGTRIGPSDASETPNVRTWRQFAAAPSAGERAPDGVARRAEDGSRVHLADVFSACQHTLLLFDGQAPTVEGYENLSRIAAEAEGLYGESVNIFVVVPAPERPGELIWTGPVLLDTEGTLEEMYGASSECVYVVRPDRFIGFRSQPAERERLRVYLDSIFAH